MKRSHINRIMEKGLDFIEHEMRFHLPPFARWSPRDWQNKGSECHEIVSHQLGWDITDFGKGDFANTGLLLFTIRNGTLQDLDKLNGKTYAEKILLVRNGQITPTHFHFQKMEDIINRGGGRLVLQLWYSTKDAGLNLRDNLHVSIDGTDNEVKPGGLVILSPGESICLPPYLYHSFHAEGDDVLVGEVSCVNDDYIDNNFYENVGRFAGIDEDAEPLYLLYNDYTRYYRAGG